MSIIAKANLMQGYENALLETYHDFKSTDKNTFAYDHLETDSEGGLPIAVQRQSGILYETYTEDTHALIIGATRSGKTTSYIIPTIFSKAHQKRKDSMLITDPKGELYSKCAAMLKKQGYKVILLNFRDHRHSECWNPLTPIFRKYQKAIQLDTLVGVEKVGNKYFHTFCGARYYSQKELEDEITRQRALIIDDVANDIDDLACGIMPTENTKEPYWEDSARQLFSAFLWAMLEDSVPDGSEQCSVTEDNFSFRSILKILASFRYGGDGGNDNGYFSNRDGTSRAYQLAKEPVISNANSTRMCVLSSFNGKMSAFREVIASLITCCNTFEIEDIVNGKEPAAIFVSYRDEAKVSYKVIQLFISATYNKLIEIANRKDALQLEHPFYFILDEFGNLPKIKDFETTISACGGRNIWFVLVLQSYAQLYNVYGRDVGEIIKDNLNMHIFLGTNNYETKRAFSEECGVKTIFSPLGALNGEGVRQTRFEKDIVPLIPISKLSHFETGECVITRTNAKAVLWSMLERSYLCPEFVFDTANAKEYQVNVDFFLEKYIYFVEKRRKGRKDSSFLF